MIHHWSGRISGGDTGNHYGHVTYNGGRRVRVVITLHIHVYIIIEIVIVVDGDEDSTSSSSYNDDNLDYEVDMDVEGDEDSNSSPSIVGEVTISVAGVSTGDSTTPMTNLWQESQN
ncbi:hypothetical protein KY289_002687 [Solanum tuberosum]|nr:hypothetical protein KY289_002687 [Solanum tuberosum]